MIYAIRAHSLHLSGEAVVHYGFMILYPLGNVALYGSIYLTLAVSIERFLGEFLFRDTYYYYLHQPSYGS